MAHKRRVETPKTRGGNVKEHVHPEWGKVKVEPTYLEDIREFTREQDELKRKQEEYRARLKAEGRVF